MLIKCCVDGYNFNNLIFYTQQDAVCEVYKTLCSETVEGIYYEREEKSLSVTIMISQY
jgi:hypothetical protein